MTSFTLLRTLTALNSTVTAAAHKGSVAGFHSPTDGCPRVVRPDGSPRTPSTFPTHTIFNLVGSEGTVFVWQEYTLGTYVCMNTHRGDICNAVEQDKIPPPCPSKLTIGEHALGVLRNFLKYSKGVTREVRKLKAWRGVMEARRTGCH